MVNETREQVTRDLSVTPGWEMHTFETVTRHSDGRETRGKYQEAIHTSVTHLVQIPCDAEKPSEPDAMLIRAWSIEEAREIARGHRVKESNIWERLPNRSFCSLGH